MAVSGRPGSASPSVASSESTSSVGTVAPAIARAVSDGIAGANVPDVTPALVATASFPPYPDAGGGAGERYTLASAASADEKEDRAGERRDALGVPPRTGVLSPVYDSSSSLAASDGLPVGESLAKMRADAAELDAALEHHCKAFREQSLDALYGTSEERKQRLRDHGYAF